MSWRDKKRDVEFKITKVYDKEQPAIKEGSNEIPKKESIIEAESLDQHRFLFRITIDKKNLIHREFIKGHLMKIYETKLQIFNRNKELFDQYLNETGLKTGDTL